MDLVRMVSRPIRPLVFEVPVHNWTRRQFSMEAAATAIPNYFTHWSVTQVCQFSLETVHVHVGLPWWAAIVGTTLAFKLLTSPLLYAGEKAVATHSRMKAILRLQMPRIKADVERYSSAFNLSEEKKRLWTELSARKYEKLLIEQLQCHPFSLLCWPLLQAPIWIGMSFAVRNFSGQNPLYFEYDDAVVEELQTQGALWFSNLAVPDPFCIVPAITCVLYLLAPTVSSLGTPVTAQKTLVFRLSRAANAIATGFITYAALHSPVVVPLYWMASMFFTLVLRLILKFPRMRRALSIDRAPFESATPMKELSLRMIRRWNPETAPAKSSQRILGGDHR